IGVDMVRMIASSSASRMIVGAFWAAAGTAGSTRLQLMSATIRARAHEEAARDSARNGERNFMGSAKNRGCGKNHSPLASLAVEAKVSTRGRQRRPGSWRATSEGQHRKVMTMRRLERSE